MENRKRNIQMKFYVTEEEKRLIDEKMKQLPIKQYGAYFRKMAIDGYIGKNHVTDVMIAQYPWMQRFPWYVTISECDVLDAPLVEGIPLDEVWDALGSDTYLASFGRHESIPAVSRKHYQKAHIRLSGNAKQYIDKRLDTLFEQFGTIHYVSAT